MPHLGGVCAGDADVGRRANWGRRRLRRAGRWGRGGLLGRGKAGGRPSSRQARRLGSRRRRRHKQCWRLHLLSQQLTHSALQHMVIVFEVVM